MSDCVGAKARSSTSRCRAATERRRPRGFGARPGCTKAITRNRVLIRSAAEAKIREADRLECDAWNAIMWAGGPAMPSPGEPQAKPAIAKAINAGFDSLEARCNRCDPFIASRAVKAGITAAGSGPIY
jgi:hypothetical protein